MNFKRLFVFALVALVGMANGETAVQEVDAVSRELQVVDFSTKMLNAVNSKRAARGLKAVCINTKLTKAAQVLANDLAKYNRVSTTGSDGSTPRSRYAAQNIKTTRSAELVAGGFTTVDAVVAAWMKSAGAYIYSDLKFIGPGYKYDSTKQYKHYWVIDMANAPGILK
ncbi:hypothetical protein BBO99_00009798 [Phytophthora kernoviae]|uniref:SCP domain-containing protein n=2 Tax=Phytophthora kernoviae TaxID=325452 RepID=A0A3R7J4R6_9STRA|nr:hypothetical protein G195_011612 [Phytophthora kernoviae 00238/432]KAG2502539.1 hypothetical protein JM16_009657 [Phytophthora kernoviae]KAG2502775.1 hypothetical protein JM18_009789 [Phytophthora kernoviae]RLN21187.1 hypothetical protein BBI17_009851 [Phytophthora kernoviae]RLN72436.1 hypothetical protein BBO99_00009798 [Phytophthora kernoviae]